jgi:hypothetical protein
MKDIQIYTTYFDNIENLPKNIIPISIAGMPPSYWDGLEYKKLAPKWSFFKEWKHNNDNNFYIRHFYEEVLNKLNPDKVIEELFEKVGSKTDLSIALVCYEKPKEFCHRHLVGSWLIQHGYIVKEYEDLAEPTEDLEQSIRESLLECFEIDGNKCVLFLSNQTNYKKVVEYFFDGFLDNYGVKNYTIHHNRDNLDIKFNNGSRFFVCILRDNSKGIRWNKMICDSSIDNKLIDSIVYPLYTPCRISKNSAIIYDTKNYLTKVKIP